MKKGGNMQAGADEEDSYETFQDPPLRHRKSHKARETVILHPIPTTELLSLPLSGGDVVDGSVDASEPIVADEDRNIPADQMSNSGFFKVSYRACRRRGAGKAKGRERALELKQGRKMKYADATDEESCYSDCTPAGHQLRSPRGVRSTPAAESLLRQAPSLPSSDRQASTSSPNSKSTKPTTTASTQRLQSRTASTNASPSFHTDDVEDCPIARREFLARFLPLLHSNLCATRERINTGQSFIGGSATRLNSWGSPVDSAILTSSSVNGVDMRELWREMLLWLQDYNEAVIHTHFNQRDDLAAQLLHDILTFRFDMPQVQEEKEVEAALMRGDLVHSYLSRVHACMQRVEAMIQQVDRLSYLCMSQRHLCTLYPGFAAPEVKQRLACMHMWRQMLHHLNTSLYSLFLHLRAHRQHFAPLLLDFQVPSLSEEDTLDLGVGDVARFEDDILIQMWPTEYRALCAGDATSTSFHSENSLTSSAARNALYRKYVNKHIHRDGLAQLRLHLDRVLQNVVPYAVRCLKLISNGDASAVFEIEHQIQRLQAVEAQLTVEGFWERREMASSSYHSQHPHHHLSHHHTATVANGNGTDRLGEKVVNCVSHEEQDLIGAEDCGSVWSAPFKDMQLPSFLPHFLFLVRCPLDILYQCMIARGDASNMMCNPGTQQQDAPALTSAVPSSNFGADLETEEVVDYATVVQLFRECKETMLGAIHAKLYFHQKVLQVLPSTTPLPTEQDEVMIVVNERLGGGESWRCLPEEEAYEQKLRALMQDYFRYLWHILTRLQTCQESLLESSGFDTILEKEWRFIKVVSPHISDGEVEASRLFCRLAAFFVKSIEQFISDAWNELVRKIDYELQEIDMAEFTCQSADMMMEENSEEDEELCDTSGMGDGGPPSEMDVDVTTKHLNLSAISHQMSLDNSTPLSSSPSDTARCWMQSSSTNLNYLTTPTLSAIGNNELSSANNSASKMRRLMMKSFRDIEDIFDDAKKRLQKATDNIRFLCKDLQIAASMNFTTTTKEGSVGSSQQQHQHQLQLRKQERRFLTVLQETGHVLVHCDRHARREHLVLSSNNLPDDEDTNGRTIHDSFANCSHFDSGKISLFVPPCLATNDKRILELLEITFGTCPTAHHQSDENMEYLLFVECGLDDRASEAISLSNKSGNLVWSGGQLRLLSNVDHTVKLSHAEVSGILMMTADSCQLERCYKHLLSLCPPGLLRVRDPHRACNQSIALALDQLKEAALNLGDAIPETISRMQEYLLMVHSGMDTVHRPEDSFDTRNQWAALGYDLHKKLEKNDVFQEPQPPASSVGSSGLLTHPLSMPSFLPSSSGTMNNTATGIASSSSHKVRGKFRDCMQRCYRAAFFYHRELLRMTTELQVRRRRLAPSIVRLLDHWIMFLRNYYEKTGLPQGGGLPSWAQDGCAFLQTVLQSNLVGLMSSDEWNTLYQAILVITPHLMGVSLEKRTSISPASTYANQLMMATSSGDALSSVPPLSHSPHMFDNQRSQPAELPQQKQTDMGMSLLQDKDYRRAYSVTAGLKLATEQQQVSNPPRNPDAETMPTSGLSMASQTYRKGSLVSDNSAMSLCLPPVEESPHMTTRSLSGESGGGGGGGGGGGVPPTDLATSTSQVMEERQSIAEVRQSMLQRLAELDDYRTELLQRSRIVGRVWRQQTTTTHGHISGVLEPPPQHHHHHHRHHGGGGGQVDVEDSPSPVVGPAAQFETVLASSTGVVRQVNFKWKIGRKLGRGTFGEVFEAIRMDTNESIVVKRMKRPTAPGVAPAPLQHTGVTSTQAAEFARRDEQMVRDILREFDMFVTLQHPNLVRYYGIEINENESLIFMERCPGRTLASQVEQSLEEVVIRKYANKLLHALAYLHDKNIVHRDVKPENIMLCEPQDPALLKLTDFGSAARIPHCSQFSSSCVRGGSLGGSGLLLPEMQGTLNYMAPEVCCANAHGVKCDVWSFACVIWELFEGKRPHHDSAPPRILYKISKWKEESSQSPPLPRPKGASDDSWAFILSCLRANPDDRPSSEDLLQSDFVKVMGNSLSSSQIPGNQHNMIDTPAPAMSAVIHHFHHQHHKTQK